MHGKAHGVVLIHCNDTHSEREKLEEEVRIYARSST